MLIYPLNNLPKMSHLTIIYFNIWIKFDVMARIQCHASTIFRSYLIICKFSAVLCHVRFYDTVKAENPGAWCKIQAKPDTN